MLDIIYYTLQVLAGFIIFSTVWAWLPLTYWWVRIFDFPRIQFICLGILLGVGLLFFIDEFDSLQWTLLIGLVIALSLQLKMVLPYTRLWSKQVKDTTLNSKAAQLKLMVSNVLTPNDNTDALVSLVQTKQPDVLITLESDQKWQDALEAIEPEYPYSVKIPLDNLYGMHLYSKLELIDPEVKFLLIDDIPSIHTQLKLRSGKVIWLYCMHPMPPSPTEADKSTSRDAELLLMAKHIEKQDQTVILAGDLNDVAWSKTTRMFQRISELLDPRIGRRFINTFHAKYPPVRWALDHIFHSADFTLVDIERQPYIGSDHFPVMTTLQYDPQQQQAQKTQITHASATDLHKSNQKIAEGKVEGRRLSKEHAAESDNE